MVALFQLYQALQRVPTDLVILGNSNSIGPNSFAARLGDDRSLVTRNLSVGASSSAVGLYMLDALPPARHGALAVIDYSINDHLTARFLWGEERARELISGHLRTLAARLRSRGYFPLVLIVPAQISRPQVLLGEKLHEELCREFRIAFLNLRRVFKQAISSGATEAALMHEDEFHMSPAAQSALAVFVREFLVRQQQAAPRPLPHRDQILATRIVTAETLFDPRALRRRKSSLRTAAYGRLLPGERIAVPIGGRERLAGLVINAGAAGGRIAIQSEQAEVVKALDFSWSDEDRGAFFSVLVDISANVSGDATITLVANERTPTEATVHSVERLPGAPSAVEIEGILVTGLDEVEFAYSAPAYADLPADLNELPETIRLRATLAALR